jgi:hypothetical protein
MADEPGARCSSLRPSKPWFQFGGGLLVVSDVETLQFGVLKLTTCRFFWVYVVLSTLVGLVAKDASTFHHLLGSVF